MGKTSLRLPDDMLDALDAEAEERGLTRSEYVRRTLARRTEYDDLKRENQRLRREKRALIQQREEHGELVAYAEAHRELMQRERERRDAPLWRRAAWWVLGRD